MENAKPAFRGMGEISFKSSECGCFCVIRVVDSKGETSFELDREEVQRLAVTLLHMSPTLKDPPARG